MASSDEPKNDWIESYKDVQNQRARTPKGENWEDEWKTLVQIREELGIGECKVRKILHQLQAAGKCDIHVGSGVNPSGCLVKRVWYKLEN
jgi:hypothetical protein